LQHHQLISASAHQVSEQDFPGHLTVAGSELKLTYSFAPGDETDGITLHIPLILLNQISAVRCQWLVPGLIQAKCLALIKGLPKALRKHIVPATNFVDRFLAETDGYQQPLTDALAQYVKHCTGIVIDPDQWDLAKLEPRHLMRFCLLDDKGKVLACSRDLVQLNKAFGEQLGRLVSDHSATSRIAKQGLKDWDFGDLPPCCEEQKADVKLRLYPALVDQGSAVDLRLVESKAKAEQLSVQGLKRLYWLQLQPQIKQAGKQLPGLTQMVLYYRSIGTHAELLNDLVMTTISRVFVISIKQITTQHAFHHNLVANKKHFVPCLYQLAEQLLTILSSRQQLVKALAAISQPSYLKACQDINKQLAGLIYPGFLLATPANWLQHYPRYLQAMAIRLDKLSGQLVKDQGYMDQVQPLEQSYQDYLQDRSQACLADHSILTQQLVDYRFLLEEFRVSLFAQSLKTCVPVSLKRLAKSWQAISQQY
jgi:ATP-dependent helicase HrpA